MKNTFKAGDWVVLKTKPAQKMKVEQIMGPELYRCILFVDHTEQYIDFKGDELMIYTKP
jgi:hypothetical protein